jgi:hypothetical protein
MFGVEERQGEREQQQQQQDRRPSYVMLSRRGKNQ